MVIIYRSSVNPIMNANPMASHKTHDSMLLWNIGLSPDSAALQHMKPSLWLYFCTSFSSYTVLNLMSVYKQILRGSCKTSVIFIFTIGCPEEAETGQVSWSHII